ncbi:MAG: SIS domain-containing protein, partial [Candidatus Bipolaricaulota bacterium]
VKAVRYADAKYGMDGFGFTCYPDSKLASSVNYAFTIEEGQEESVVMTKSFTGMLVALQRTATIYAGAHESYEELETLPSVIEETLHSSEKVIQALLTEGRPSQYVFLGAGPFYGLANESMLKMKEMALQITESFHPLEYRHGPKSTASEETLISVYCSDSGLDYELTLLQELKELGAQVVAISEQNGHLDRAVDFSLTLDSNLDQFLRISSYLPFAQLLALKVALAQGLNPDHPRNLDQVVRLEE